jgi:hypothetical protein
MLVEIVKYVRHLGFAATEVVDLNLDLLLNKTHCVVAPEHMHEIGIVVRSGLVRGYPNPSVKEQYYIVYLSQSCEYVVTSEAEIRKLDAC